MALNTIKEEAQQFWLKALNWDAMVSYKQDEWHIAEGLTGEPPMPSFFAKALEGVL